MRQTAKVAVARLVMRDKQHLAVIRPLGEVLALATMYFQDEIVSPTTIHDLPQDQEISDRELAMATQLIDALSASFDHGKYKDEYRRQVMAMIEKKAAGQQIIAGQAAPAGPKVVDLMAALEASIAAAKPRAGATGRRRKAGA